VLSLATWIVTIALVGLMSLTGVYALVILGYGVYWNATDAQGSAWGALVSAVAGLLIPTASAIAYWIARRHALRGRPLALIVAGVIFGTVMGLYMLYLTLIIVFGP
jgi:hypothetical protein